MNQEKKFGEFITTLLAGVSASTLFGKSDAAPAWEVDGGSLEAPSIRHASTPEEENVPLV